MTLGIGGYNLGNNATRLKRSSTLEKAMYKLEEAGNFTVQKMITPDEAKKILGQFGLKPKTISQIVPETGSIRYTAAHGAAQLSVNGKPIYNVVKSLKRPIGHFIFDNLAYLAQKIVK